MSDPPAPGPSGSPLERIGLGLWTMRSVAFAPRNRIASYQVFAGDAGLAEQLGFHSIWSAEHRLWYDGWVPSPLHAQAAAVANTTRLRFGNAVLLLPQHDPVALARSAATLDRLSRGRVELGAGLGHRDVEFDALGRRRDRRGLLMDEALAVLQEVWSGARGDAPPHQRPGPPIWIGGMAPRALDRAARGGHNLMLPQTLHPPELGRIVHELRSRHPAPQRIGTVRDVCIEPDSALARAARRRHELHFTEEAGWWILKGRPAYDVPDQLARQMRRVTDAALIGGAEEVAAGLRALYEAGADFIVLRVQFDMAGHAGVHEQMHRAAELLPPLLNDLTAAR